MQDKGMKTGLSEEAWAGIQGRGRADRRKRKGTLGRAQGWQKPQVLVVQEREVGGVEARCSMWTRVQGFLANSRRLKPPLTSPTLGVGW